MCARVTIQTSALFNNYLFYIVRVINKLTLKINLISGVLFLYYQIQLYPSSSSFDYFATILSSHFLCVMEQ